MKRKAKLKELRTIVCMASGALKISETSLTFRRAVPMPVCGIPCSVLRLDKSTAPCALPSSVTHIMHNGWHVEHYRRFLVKPESLRSVVMTRLGKDK